jgi:hypothetical protein
MAGLACIALLVAAFWWRKDGEDWLAAVVGAISVVGVFVAFWYQSQQLTVQREDLREQRKEAERQTQELKEQARALREQVDSSRHAAMHSAAAYGVVAVVGSHSVGATFCGPIMRSTCLVWERTRDGSVIWLGGAELDQPGPESRYRSTDLAKGLAEREKLKEHLAYTVVYIHAANFFGGTWHSVAFVNDGERIEAEHTRVEIAPDGSSPRGLYPAPGHTFTFPEGVRRLLGQSNLGEECLRLPHRRTFLP